MKTRHFIIMAAALALTASCYEDLSTEADNPIPDIDFSSEVKDTVLISFGDSLVIRNLVTQDGRSDSDFEYLWEMDLQAGKSSDRVEVGTDRDLQYLVKNKPDLNPYNLSLTVTDRQSGYSIIRRWVVYVSSSLGEGLVVGHTRDGGVTSELDLICSPAVTYGYTSEAHITRNLFNLGNGTPIEGNVNAICSFSASESALYSMNYMMVGTDSHMYGLDPSTFTVDKKDAEFITMSAPESFKTTLLFSFDGYQFVAVTGGRPFGCNTNMEWQMNPVPGQFSKYDAYAPRRVAYGKIRQAQIALFDDEQKAFYATEGWMHTSSGMSKVTDISSLKFTLSTARCLGAGGGKNNIMYFVMRDAEGKTWLVTVDAGQTLVTPTSLELTGTGVSDAELFAFVDSGSIFYYVADGKVYYNIISATKVTTRATTWAPESEDEVVTGIEPYYQSWYGTHNYDMSDYGFVLSTNRMQMIITTYNEKTGEGKVYLQGFTPSTGRFSQSNGIYGGFGRITATGASLR